MNDKLSLQDLADILSQQTQISKKEAEFFFKEFFQLILDRIYENDLVKVKDFGTFKLTAINSRESVDVNTGEKIEIPAHYRFTFLPDKALKELVNKPFSKYQTVLLEDGMDPSTVNFELQTNIEEDSDTIDDNEVLKVIQEQVKLVNELKTQPTQPKTELGKTKARGSKIELIEKIPETTLSKKDEASYRSTQKPFVYTYSNSKIDENKKDEDVILMTVPRRNRIPKIGEDSNVADVSKESVVKSDNLSSKKIEDKKEVKDTDRKTGLVNKSGQSDIEDSIIDIETTIYSISDTISKQQEISVEKQREYSDINVDSESTTVKTLAVPSDRESDLVSQENIPTLSRNISTVSADKRPTDIKSYKSYNNPDRPLIPEEGNNDRGRPDFISTKIDSNSINDVEEIDIDTTFLNIDNPDLEAIDKADKILLSDSAKDRISDDTEVRDVENDPFFNFETQSAKRAKLKKIIPITILILIVLAVLIYGLFKLFDVKYDYERYQGLGTSNLTMADTLPYLYEKEDPLPLTAKDSSIIQDYADSLSEKNTVVVNNEVSTDTLKSATVQNINGSLLFDGSEKNREDETKRNVSDNLSINVVNKAQSFLNKKNGVKDNDGSVHNLSENQSNAIESSRYPIQPKTTSANSIKLEQGMTLRSIANKYYGNANYWVYIYMANKEKLPNPDAITVGLELSIPPLSQYGVIDAKDPLEIQRAQKMEMQVLG